MGLIDCFPQTFNPSSSQQSVISQIDKAFNSDYKFVICNAPTGSGKSFISKTLGNSSATCSEDFRDLVDSYDIFKRDRYNQYQADVTDTFGAFVLTITKSLQDQYKSLFSDLELLKGQSNYQCTYDENYTVDTAPCLYIKTLKDQCWKKNSCTYYTQRNKVLTSRFAALNYNMFFALPDHVKSKEYIICDEASELEDQLVKEFTCSINFKTLKRLNVDIIPLPNNSNYTALERWLEKMSSNLEDRIDELKSLLAGKNNLQNIYDVKNTLSTLTVIKSKVKTLISTWRDSEYIFERNEEGVIFIPLKVDKLANYIFRHGKKILLMSATIIDPDTFAKTLGIERYKYIESKSTFDPQKAPIYTATKIKLNYNNLNSNLPKIVKIINDICEFHKNEKGIIHTQTNFITAHLSKNLQNKRVIYREAGVNNEALLKQHIASSTPSILASPSMLFGVDLKDELARFQIIIKAPFLPMTDKRVKEMIKIYPPWYVNKMLASLIQACGRGIRSKNDHCVTYILDGAIIEAVISNKHKLPKYFLERFV